MVVLPDASLENADWTKRTWDILPPTAETLLRTLGVENASHANQRAALRHFMTLPAAKAMPATLRAELSKMGVLE